MAGLNSIDESNAELLSAALAEISDAAYSVRNFAQQIVQQAGRNNNLVNMAIGIEGLVSKAGWLADVCLQHLGAMPTVGGAQEWMTSPRFLKAVEDMAAERERPQP